MEKNTSEHNWQVFDLKQLVAKVAGDEPKIHEFLCAPSMSCAVYHLPQGCKDMQSPHVEDEVYLVLSGKGRLRTGDTNHNVEPGKILYVKANTQHSFFDIDEDLTVLALFGAQSEFER